MTYTAISLTDPVSGVSVPIMPRDGVKAQTLDTAASARAVTEDKVGAHGAWDSTRFNAAGAVSLSMLLYPGDDGSQPEGFLDQLGPLLDPAGRFYLVATNDQWDQPRQVLVRYDNIAKPVSGPEALPVQVQWQAPKAVWEGTVKVTTILGAFIASTSGLTVSPSGLTIAPGGLVMPPTSAPQPSQVASGGAAASQWLAYLYGPCTGPKLANDTAGGAIEFSPNLVLGSGEYVLLDSYAQTALRNGTDNVKSLLNFATLNWWLILRGLNVLRYYPVTASPGSQAVLSFAPAWPL